MATHDYSEDLATAIELANEFGSNVTLLQFAITPPDGSKPWRGPNTPDSPPLATRTVKAIKVGTGLGSLTTAEDLDDKTDIQLYVVPPVGETLDYTTFDVVVIGSKKWSIDKADKLQPDPNGLILLYKLDCSG